MDKPEKKTRFSRLLGGKREKSSERPTLDPDSAYASSETPSRDAPLETPNATPEFVPAERNSDIANIDRDRNLELNPASGEVRDQDTGELVTVVTTTTTTTTTTTRKPGKQPEVQKDVKQDVQESAPAILPPPVTAVPSTVPTDAPSGPSEMPANPPMSETTRSSSRPPRNSPPLPIKSAARKSGEYASPQPQAATYPGYDENLPPPTGGFYGGGQDMPQPPPGPPPGPPGGNFDVRSPSPSANKHNFSYPARNRNSMEPSSPVSAITTSDRPQQHKQGTMSDLMAAAKGIHGVGETLRGTLNKTVDERYPRKNADKAAYASAKNEAVLAKGRTEMGGIPQHGGGALGPGPVPGEMPQYQRTKTNDQIVPGSFSEEDQLRHEAAPTAAEHDQRENQKARSIGKLFKRKPVAKEEGGLRVTNP